MADPDYVLEQNGFRNSGDGLAICSRPEIVGLLRDLGEDALACQVRFQLGCNFYNAATGARRPHPLTLHDFLRHTDVADSRTLIACLERINLALHRRRSDPDAAIYHRDGHGGFLVHEETQHAIYQLWQRLLRRTSTRLKSPAG